MRIIHEETIGKARLSVFTFHDKYTVKIELENKEMIYKIRDGIFDHKDALVASIKNAFNEEIIPLFYSMNNFKLKLEKQSELDGDEGFDEIV